MNTKTIKTKISIVKLINQVTNMNCWKHEAIKEAATIDACQVCQQSIGKRVTSIIKSINVDKIDTVVCNILSDDKLFDTTKALMDVAKQYISDADVLGTSIETSIIKHIRKEFPKRELTEKELYIQKLKDEIFAVQESMRDD